MQIVIDIDDALYRSVTNNDAYVLEDVDWILLENAIANGTPLPEGHGRLVDFSEVLIKLMQFYDGNKSIGQCLDEVHTVIEADGGDAE